MTAPRRTMRALSLALFLVVTIHLVVGCGQREGAEQGTSDGAFVVTQESTKGPVHARIGLDAEEVSIAGFVTLRVEIDAREDVELRLPEPEAISIEPFTVRSYEAEKPRLGDDGRVVAAVTLELEPFLSGEYQLGPVPIEFTLSGDAPDDGGEVKVYDMAVEPVSVRVTSLTGEASAELDIRDLAAPVGLPEQPGPGIPSWVWFAAAGSVILLAAIGLVVARGRREPVEKGPRLTPREAALQALDQLEQKKLLEADRVQEFYFEICLILREFIEGEFGLRAAEETTEEFLAELVSETRFDGQTKSLLQRFLEHCDMVKFARYAPAEKEIEDTVEVTRSFITRSQSAAPSTASLATGSGSASEHSGTAVGANSNTVAVGNSPEEDRHGS